MKKIVCNILCFMMIVGVMGEVNIKAEVKEEKNYDVNKYNSNTIAILTNCENGTKYVYKLPETNNLRSNYSIQKSKDDIITIESEVQVLIPNNNNNKPVLLANSTSSEEYDGSLSWKAYIKSTYKKNGSKYLLTQTNGGWKCSDTSVNISGRNVTYGCGSSQVSTKKPSKNTFKYNTGFKKYTPLGGWNVIGSNSYCYLKRGTGKKWLLEVIANL